MASIDPPRLIDRAANGVLWSLGSAWGVSIVQVLVLLGLSRLLDAEAFGLMSAVLIVIGFGDVFANLGVGGAIVQAESLSRRQKSGAFWICTAMGLVISLAVFACAPLLSALMKMPKLTPLLEYSAGIFVVRAASIAPQGLLHRELSFRTTSIIELGTYTFVYATVAFALGFSGFDAAALVSAAIAQSACRFIWLFLKSETPTTEGFTFSDLKPLLFFGGGQTAGTITSFIARNVDSVIIGRYLGEASLGIYNRTSRLMLATASLMTRVLERVLFAAVARNSDNEKVGEVFLAGLRLVSIVFFPLTIISVFLAEEIIYLSLGSGWSEAVAPFQALTIGLFFRTSYKISAAYAKARGAVYAFASRTSVYAVCVAVGAAVGAVYGSLLVACVGVTIAQVIVFLLTTQLSARVLDVPLGSCASQHVPGLGLAFATTAVLFLTHAFFPEHLTAPGEISIAFGIVCGLLGVGINLTLLTVFPRLILGSFVTDAVAERLPRKFRPYLKPNE